MNEIKLPEFPCVQVPRIDADIDLLDIGRLSRWCRQVARDYAREAVRLNAQVDAKPMFWVRLCSDGCYEGPIHNSRIEDVRKQSGAWHPLYLSAPSAPQPAQPLKVTDAMAYSFHSAISDGSIGVDEVEDIKRGLAAALANYEAPQPAQQPLTDEQIQEGARNAPVWDEDSPEVSFELGVRFAERMHGIGEN